MKTNCSDLTWYYGTGSSIVLRTSQGISPVRGDGNSGTKGTMPRGCGPDPDSVVRYGQIGRALAAIPPELEAVLSRAYGDAGRAVSEGGVQLRRWPAVAPLTAFASKLGRLWATKQKQRPENRPKKWTKKAIPPRPPKKERTPEEVQADEVKRDPLLGPPEARWVNQLLANRRPSVEERAAVERLREDATALLQAAEAAYTAARGRLEHGERATRRAAWDADARAVGA